MVGEFGHTGCDQETGTTPALFPGCSVCTFHGHLVDWWGEIASESTNSSAPYWHEENKSCELTSEFSLY